MELRKGYKQTEIGVIPEDWEVKNIGSIGSVKMCKRIFSYQTKDEGDVPFYKIGTFGKEADAFISESLFSEFKNKYSYPKIGEILISASGTIGRTVVYNGERAYYQDSNIVWVENNLNLVTNEFLYFIYKSINFNTEGSTIKRLYNNLLLSTLFICPPLSEQKAIVHVLTDTDQLIQNLKTLIAKKKAIKKGVMQELLTGKKRLKNFTENWVSQRLGEIATFQKGKMLSKSDLKFNGKNKCIHYGELFTKYSEVIKNIKSRTNVSKDVFTSKKNDILMPTSDVTPNGLATASCINEDGVILGGDILVIRASESVLNGVFFSFLISISKGKIMQLVTGSTVYHLYGSDMSKFEFKMPKDIEEQKAIAQILFDMDEEIRALNIQLQKTQNLKDGIMQELLTGKIRLINPTIQTSNKESTLMAAEQGEVYKRK